MQTTTASTKGMNAMGTITAEMHRMRIRQNAAVSIRMFRNIFLYLYASAFKDLRRNLKLTTGHHHFYRVYLD